MRPLSYFLSRNSQAKIKIRKTTLTWKHVQDWDKSVQPTINKYYKKASHIETEISTGIRIRADVGWSWRKQYAVTKLLSLVDALNEEPHNRKAFLAEGLMVEIATDRENHVPFAPMIVAPRFRCHLQDCVDGKSDGVRGFIWYLTKAPDEYLQEKEINVRPGNVIQGLIYAACETISKYDNNEKDKLLPYDRSILLHADKHGGVSLREAYEKLGLVACKQQSAKISTFRSGNEANEYFVLSQEKADNLANEVNNKELVD